jgi:hypothetical protein
MQLIICYDISKGQQIYAFNSVALIKWVAWKAITTRHPAICTDTRTLILLVILSYANQPLALSTS